jgi:folate-binding protein YgfZ
LYIFRLQPAPHARIFAMSTSAVTAPAGYLAATESVAIYPVPNPGYILISGETRREYLQRQTTNDIDLLAPGRALPTLLTAPTGRILEYYVLLENGNSIAMITQPGHGPGNAAYFQKRIFFNDRVTIQDQSAKWIQMELHGPRSGEIFKEFNFKGSPTLDEVVEAKWKGEIIHGVGQVGFGRTIRFRLIVPAQLTDYLTNQLTNYPQLSFSTREILRIEAGHAGEPEFAAETTPFELGMDRLVSTAKGCYTGQEVLARQLTYDKVVRRLVRLSAGQPVPVGESLRFDGKSVGHITSVAISPRLGPIALGIVRKPYDEAGTSLQVESQGSTIIAIVV